MPAPCGLRFPGLLAYQAGCSEGSCRREPPRVPSPPTGSRQLTSSQKASLSLLNMPSPFGLFVVVKDKLYFSVDQKSIGMLSGHSRVLFSDVTFDLYESNLFFFFSLQKIYTKDSFCNIVNKIPHKFHMVYCVGSSHNKVKNACLFSN